MLPQSGKLNEDLNSPLLLAKSAGGGWWWGLEALPLRGLWFHRSSAVIIKDKSQI